MRGLVGGPQEDRRAGDVDNFRLSKHHGRRRRSQSRKRIERGYCCPRHWYPPAESAVVAVLRGPSAAPVLPQLKVQGPVAPNYVTLPLGSCSSGEISCRCGDRIRFGSAGRAPEEPIGNRCSCGAQTSPHFPRCARVFENAGNVLTLLAFGKPSTRPDFHQLHFEIWTS
jgi:hypothetical protein